METLSNFRWKVMRNMPTPRFRSAVVRITSFGFLVIGGTNLENQSGLYSAEIFFDTTFNERDIQVWNRVEPMLRPCSQPLATSPDERAFVIDGEGHAAHIQMFRYFYGDNGQWTLFLRHDNPNNHSMCWSLSTFRNMLLLSCAYTISLLRLSNASNFML